MSTPNLLPDAALVKVHYLAADREQITVLASTVQTAPLCPRCAQPAQRVHSHYGRTLADQPWKGLPVQLRLTSRRWFCDYPNCPRVIFAEPLPGLGPRWARRTKRVTELFQRVAYALGGEGGARLLQPFGHSVSPEALPHFW